MATVYRPRGSIDRSSPGGWRGNKVRQDGMLNLRMQPALGYEHHRGNVVGFVLLVGLVFVIAIGIIQLFTPVSTTHTTATALVLTPAVTVQYVAEATALPVMSVPQSAALVTIHDVTGQATLYTGPGLSYQRLAVVPSGETATLIGRSADNQWWLIGFQGQIGWINAYRAEFNGDLTQVPLAEAQ